jgi:uncharacterized protein YcfJ
VKSLHALILKEKKMFRKLFLPLALLAAAPAVAHDGYVYETTEILGPASYEVSHPRRECWNEVVHDGYGRSPAGAVIGGIAGGILGHQVGGGSGKTVATAVGAITGAIVGDRIGNDSARGYRTVQRCRTVEPVATIYRPRETVVVTRPVPVVREVIYIYDDRPGHPGLHRGWYKHRHF